MFIANDNPTPPKFKYIGDDDQAAYSTWTAPYINRFFPIHPPPLYHYTTGNALVEILKSGELWSTQLNCLNDASELLYTRARLRIRAEQKLASPLAPEIKSLLEKIVYELGHPLLGIWGWFVACFTEDGDDLSQWRAYGSGEGGYSIEFDSVYLRRMSHQQELVLGKVEYDERKQDEFFDDLLNQTIRFFLDGIRKKRAPTTEEWVSEFLLCWSWHVAMFAPMIKHPKFGGEREWRLLYPFQNEAIPRMRYLQRSSMMTKHVPLRLMMLDGRPRLPLKGIVVGPCRHRQITRISVGDLLRTNGYFDDYYVSTTRIPYQLV
jgi:hypothetical protein